MLSNPPPATQALLVLLVIPAAIWDFRWRRIPNWLTLAGVLLGIGLNSFLYETAGLRMALQGAGLAFAIYFPLYLLHGMGAGDVKLMAAVGAVAGWQNWLGILLLTSVLGATAALVLVARRGLLSKTFENVGFILISLRSGHAPYHAAPQLDVQTSYGTRLPHGVAIAGGAIGFLLAATIWAPR